MPFFPPSPTRSVGEACEERGAVEATRLARAEREGEFWFLSFFFFYFLCRRPSFSFFAARDEETSAPLTHAPLPLLRGKGGEECGLCFHPPAVLITQKNMEKKWLEGRERGVRERDEEKETRRQKSLGDSTFRTSSPLFPFLFRINFILMSGRTLVAALAAAVLLAGAGE